MSSIRMMMVVLIIVCLEVQVSSKVAGKLFEYAILEGGKFVVKKFMKDLEEGGVYIRKPRNPSESNLLPPAAMSEYDFIIDIPHITSIVDGWPVYVSSQADEIIQGDHNSLAIVALLGYYSKGKSFVTNQLRLAGRKNLKSHGSIFGASSEGNANSGIEGDGVTTRGISGMYTGFSLDESIAKATTLILDTAGRNAPARGVPKDMAAMELDISQLRSKERLVDDVIISIADSIFYVVDEILNEDQRTILYMIQHAAETGQYVGIIHNFKRINCNSQSAKRLIQEQVIDSFGATEERFNDGEQVYGGPLSKWVSQWTVKSKGGSVEKEFAVHHFVLFDHEKCWERNNPIFNYINVMRGKARVIRDVHTFGPVEIIARAMMTHLNTYVTETDIPVDTVAEEVGIDGLQKKQMVTASPPLSPPLFDSVFWTIKKSVTKGKQLTLWPWNMRDMPLGYSTGEFIPNYNHFISDDTDIIRVDLPGLNKSMLTAGKKSMEFVPPPAPTSYVRVTFVVKDENKEKKRFCIIQGYRSPLHGDASENIYGAFNLKIPVEFYYDRQKVQMNDGLLLVLSSHQADDDIIID
jgi:hypothetical protein